MSLNSSQFHDLIDTLQEQLEDLFDESELDLDIENQGGILTIIFTNGSQLIFSRQEPLKQLWLAARSGGFHFDYLHTEQRWYCATEQLYLDAMLNKIFAEQAEAALDFPPL
ncbi:MAG: iron donor protein CyaY [Gammaproteobacteria bacterium]|jgi:CyaY protein|nr:iron donor protein CyaY [Gammaproteobacteria bacterium]